MEKELTYTSALKELEEILKSLESSEMQVDVLAIKLKRAEFLIKFCRDFLTKTEKEINSILENMKEE